MKYFMILLFALIVSKSHCQIIPIYTFTSLLSKQLSYIDDTFSKDFKAQLDDIDEAQGVYTWKKGFNATHSQNNQYIIYKSKDSTYEFWYSFVADLYYGQNSIKTYYDYYDTELKDSKYTKFDDSIEDWGYKAIVKNYQFGKYIIKIGKLASTNSAMIKNYPTITYLIKNRTERIHALF